MSHASVVTDAFQTMFNEVQERYGIEICGTVERAFDEFTAAIEDELYSTENLGELAYDAWAKKVATCSVPPRWSEIPKESQDGWIAAAAAVKEDIS
nr:hypothetical protein [Rhodococcus sp. (in: high G+C Gram-positive bacteria)]